MVARLRAAGCVFAEDEAWLLRGAAGGEQLARLVARRVSGEPLEHVLGRVGFAGLSLAVGPGVFVPRQRTALLARLAVRRARAVRGRAPVVVELCCGVAPIACAVVAAVPGARVWAADVDPVAVTYAARNLGPAGVTLVGDLDAPLPQQLRGRVDVLAVNIPYVPTDRIAELPPEAREYEPWVALDGGADGLDVQRRLAAVAPGWLAPGGAVLVETSRAQAPVAAAVFAAAGMTVSTERDESIDATAVLAIGSPEPVTV